MTVKELAERLRTTPEEIFGHYERIRHPIPKDLNFELTDEVVRMAIPKYRNETKKEDIQGKPVIETNRTQVPKPITELDRILALPRVGVLKAIRSANQVETLIFSGTLVKRQGSEAGDFVDVLSIDGKRLFYPSLDSYNTAVPISRIGIDQCQGLTFGRRYSFECELEELNKRRMKIMPYMLKTTVELVHQAQQVSDLIEVIGEKEKLLEGIENTIQEGREKVQQQVAIDQELQIAHSRKLAEYSKELETQEQILYFKYKEVEETRQELKSMEKIKETIKQRLKLCQNLQFISEKESRTYLDALTDNAADLPDHLQFKEDLDANLLELADHIHGYLYFQKDLLYTRFQIFNFLTLLRTHDLIVLSGLSGSGKTQIVKAFAAAMGGVAKIIPVKPNWTSSEDLIGYYNPIQMSFLPTPFTEAIVEARQNPTQLYFICLDEMNLARVEYYFADFLSKLEERGQEPEIELYARHQEDLFVSEFETLLSLIESSIEGIEVHSWQDFLNNGIARQRFMEYLGNADKESLLQLHAKMKRRLIDILKFPSTITIPDNVRFIGAINVDETTHYFSPKILDRIHVVKFENPLTFSEELETYFNDKDPQLFEWPVYVQPQDLATRGTYPKLNTESVLEATEFLKSLNEKFLLPMNIDFGIRSTRQSIHFIDQGLDLLAAPLNAVIAQKVLPRFVFDGNEKTRNGKTKLEILKDMHRFLEENASLKSIQDETDSAELRPSGVNASELLKEMISMAEEIGSGQVNFYA